MEPTKEAALKMKALLNKAKIGHQEPALRTRVEASIDILKLEQQTEETEGLLTEITKGTDLV